MPILDSCKMRSLLLVWFGLVGIYGQATSFDEEGCPDEQVSFELVTGANPNFLDIGSDIILHFVFL